ncbi:MerR family transcriptional regulator [Luteolibacter sp. LG18]|uniref:MerR family transcriptional regulator n=1 Tax=Luteolibacter sp. LG18 TaxID=2819286 RepID=UPI002B2913F9|nr:hypothetical protein llg_34720 [Luteolibacter sp. LG18]
MINFVLIQSSVTIEVEPEERQHYSLDEAAGRATIHPEVLRYYCRAGLLGAARVVENPEPVFDDEAVYAIRRIEHYRHHHGVNLKTLPLILNLVSELERLRDEVRRLRS